MRFLLRLVYFLIALFLVTVSHAATLTVTSDASTYSPGDNITLTVMGIIDPTSELTTNIDVRLELSGPISFVSSTADTALNPPPMFGAQTGWTVGGTQGTLSGNSITVFNQIQGLPPGGSFVNNFNGVDEAYVTATVVLMLNGVPLPSNPAVADFGVNTNFFGIGPGPGWSFVIPEPDTALLLAFGLLGLRASRRR